MAQPDGWVGEIGKVFRLTIKEDGSAVDVSAASTKDIEIQKPDGTTATLTGSFTTDGTDGKIEASTAADTLDQEGDYWLQGKYSDGIVTLYTTKVRVVVQTPIS